MVFYGCFQNYHDSSECSIWSTVGAPGVDGQRSKLDIDRDVGIDMM